MRLGTLRYDPEQQARVADPHVVLAFHQAARDLGASEVLRLALFEAGIVEANLQNPEDGDLGSVGALQQRSGWGPTSARMDPYLAALAFIRDAQRRLLPWPSSKSAGELAQAVQRSAYPDRYDAAEDAARYIIDRTEGRTVAWHLAPSLKALFAEVDARWPKRDKSADGTLGDAAHASRASEHNPDRDSDPMPTGAVSAADITRDSAAMMTAVRKALVGDKRVWYVIHDGKIWSRTHEWEPRAYTGSNPHRGHLHVSLRQTKEAHDDTSSWGIAKGDVPEPDPTPDKVPPTLRRGAADTHLTRTLQRFLFGKVVESGFADRTHLAVRRYQSAHDLEVDGIVGPKTWAVILTALKLPGYNA